MFCYVKVFTVLAILSFVSVSADDKNACKKMLDRKNMEEMCCEAMIEMIVDRKSECNMDLENMTCDDTKCSLKEAGVWDQDKDEVNEIKCEERMKEDEKQFEGIKPMTDSIRKYCLGGKYKDFPIDTCDSTKYIMCSIISFYMMCPESKRWKDSDKCKEIAGYARDCRSHIDN